jgi:hypothetical protein
MNATGKRRRKATGVNHAALHRQNHTVKTPAKRRRMHWTKSSRTNGPRD